MKMKFGSFDEFYEAATLAHDTGAKGLLWISRPFNTYDFGIESLNESPRKIDVLLVTDIGDFACRAKIPNDSDKLEHLKEKFGHKMISKIFQKKEEEQTVKIEF